MRYSKERNSNIGEAFRLNVASSFGLVYTIVFLAVRLCLST